MRLWKGFLIVFLLGNALMTLQCRTGPSPEEKARMAAEETARQWAEIQKLKDQDPDAYYDKLVTFLQNHPDHQEAIAAYIEASMPGIHAYILRGQYSRAASELRDLQKIAKTDTRLGVWADEIAAMGVVSREKFDQIQKGMGYDDVIAILGYPPLPYGMKADDIEKNGQKFHVVSFFYKNEDKGVAAVYFRNGIVYATQYLTKGQETQKAAPEK